MHCFAVVVPGLEEIVRDELQSLSVHDVEIVAGGVEFHTSPDGLCRVNLRARCITRVLVRLATFKALSFPELFNKARKIDWSRYIGKARALEITASCHQSRLMHSGRVEKALLDAIYASLGVDGPSGDAANGIQLITVRMFKDQCVISIDSSGERLDRRGYRKHPGLAPIRETLAAGILQWAGWKPGEPLIVPMCGSGTFAIEAALSGSRRAVNLDHGFAMLEWPMLRQKRWQRIRDKAAAMEKPCELLIQASDIDGGVLRQARLNAESAGVAELIQFIEHDARSLRPPEHAVSTGMLICNPPYGARIKADVKGLYQKLGEHYRKTFSGWRMVAIVPDQGCEHALGLPALQRLKIKHGGKWVHVLCFKLP